MSSYGSEMMVAPSLKEGLSFSHMKVLCFGQVLAILVAVMLASQSTLFLDCDFNAPAFSDSWVYFLLSFNLIPLLGKGRKLRNGTTVNLYPTHWFLGCIPIHANPFVYFGIAMLSFYGNYMNLLALKYTTITSVSLFDGMSIPTAMVLSWMFLGRSYRGLHLLGAAMCIGGVLMNVAIDYKADKEAESDNTTEYEVDHGSQEYPNKAIGDGLACIGGILFGINDVLTEYAVRNFGGVTELLGMLGFFGTMIAVTQMCITEREMVVDFFSGNTIADCSTGKVVGLMVAYVFSKCYRKIGFSRFLLISEATLLNLSLLTSDLYTAIFSVTIQKIIPQHLFWLAMAIVIGGIFLYEIGPSPIILGEKNDPNNVMDRERNNNIAPGRGFLDEEIELVGPMIDAEEYNPGDGRQGSRFVAFVFVFSALLMVTAMCIVLAVQTTQDGDNLFGHLGPTIPNSPDSYHEQFAALVGDDVFVPNDPAKLAADWIVKDDPMALEASDPNLYQRWVLAVFYFGATQRREWKSCNAPKASDGNNTKCQFEELVQDEGQLEYKRYTSSRWLSGDNECEWAGIICRNDKVSEIILGGHNITGHLPKALSFLPFLEAISMHYNAISGTIPAQYELMSRLKYVDLHSNQITGPIPEFLWTSDTLEILSLSENKLSGTLSERAGQLTNLQGLNLGNNNMSGTVPTSIGNLEDLTHIRLDSNFFSGNIPESIGNCKKVEELWLQKNSFSGPIPSQIGDMESIKDLQLFENQLSGRIPDELFNITQMERMELSDNNITGPIASHVGKLRNLTDFRVRNNQMTGEIPFQLAELPLLRIVWLHLNKFEGYVPDLFCKKEKFVDFLNADCGPTDSPANPCDCCTGCCDRETKLCTLTEG